jgi:hypothetical protein
MTVDAGGKAKAALAVEALQRSDFDLTAEPRQESGEPGSGPDSRFTPRRGLPPVLSSPLRQTRLVG